MDDWLNASARKAEREWQRLCDAYLPIRVKGSTCDTAAIESAVMALTQRGQGGLYQAMFRKVFLRGKESVLPRKR